MKIRYTVTFDPEKIAPKEVRDALINAGVADGDIKLNTAKEKPTEDAKTRNKKPGPTA